MKIPFVENGIAIAFTSPWPDLIKLIEESEKRSQPAAFRNVSDTRKYRAFISILFADWVVRGADVSINNIINDSRFSSPFSRYQRVETEAGRGHRVHSSVLDQHAVESIATGQSVAALARARFSRVPLAPSRPARQLVARIHSWQFANARVARDDATCHVGES